MKTLWMLLPALLLSACSTVQVGRDFDVSAFTANVKQGATTQAEVRRWMGAPSGVGVSVDTSGQRYDEWIYYYGEGSVYRSGDAKLKILQIKFDRDGVVRGYNWSGERS